jgi:hypothetical protein
VFPIIHFVVEPFFQLHRSCSNQRACPLASIPTRTFFPLGGEVATDLLRSLTVFQSLLSTISRFRIHQRNLLEARVIIASYNEHCPAPFYPSLFGWFGTTEVYSGIGAGVVMESISLAIQRRCRYRDQVIRFSPY